MVVYSQGDIVEVDFDPTKGHEPTKKRPALVVSSYDFNRSTSMTVVCPISTCEKPFFLHEKLPGNLDMEGVVIMEQIRAIDLEARQTRYLTHLSDEYLMPIIVCLKSFFD